MVEIAVDKFEWISGRKKRKWVVFRKKLIKGKTEKHKKKAHGKFGCKKKVRTLRFLCT